jgi:hypothetical protein
MPDHDLGTEYTPATLYELADAGFQDPARTILADVSAREDYDTRARHGLGMEMALAWGVAAFAAHDCAMARRHWRNAARIAPENLAAAELLRSVESDAAVSEPSPPHRAAARAELARVRNNSAFPHRLVRFATALASELDDISPAAVLSARELLEQDILEAPRSYGMVLPVLKAHYPAVYALDRPFLDSTMSVLADHGTRAQYERKRSRRPKPPKEEREARADAALPLDIPPLPRKLPPLRVPDRRWVWPSAPRLQRLPRPGYAWIGAVLGAVFFAKDGAVAMGSAAVVGFLLAYAVSIISRRT